MSVKAWDDLARAHAGRHDPPGSLPAWAHARLRAVALDWCMGLPKGARVVDLGCGRGDLAWELARRRPDLRVLGLDHSPEMLRQARARGRAPRGLSFRRASAGRWPLGPRSVDAVLALDLLAHLEPRVQLPAMLREARRCCRGCLLVELKNPPVLRALLGLRRLLRALPRLSQALLGREAGVPIHAHARPALGQGWRVRGSLRPWPLIPPSSEILVLAAEGPGR